MLDDGIFQSECIPCGKEFADGDSDDGAEWTMR